MNLTRIIQRFITWSPDASMLLFMAAILAAVLANSPFSPAYHAFFAQEVALRIGNFNLLSHNGEPMTVLSFINDALMTVFFFLVGLEIKRELLVGEISSFRKAALPFIAACGGMVMPVLVYLFLCTPAGEGTRGLAIPMATDIAFSLGVLTLLGNRVPLSLKVFLTAFAVVDDIGGILVIAIFYSSHIAIEYLLFSLILFIILYMGNKRRVSNKTFYLVIGVAIWYLFLQSGVHSTISGVLVAFLVPAWPRLKIGRYIRSIHHDIDSFPNSGEETMILSHDQIEKLRHVNTASRYVVSPLQSMEDGLYRTVNFFILPLFALANAGVVLNGSPEEGNLLGNVTISVALGLIIGKFIGIFSFTYLAVKTKLVLMPNGMNWKNLSGIALLGGIGFTVALFIANLSFNDSEALLNEAKMGVILGTIVSGILGYIVLRTTLPKVTHL